MNQTLKLKNTYKQFCEAEGNQHIASEFALLKFQELIENFEVKSILEVGLGIGAIAGSLLAINKELAYSGTENNKFCLKALKRNLGKDYERLNLFSEINEFDPKGNFDLIIIDGKDAGLQQLSRHLSAKGIIAIEGDRYEQQRELQEIFPNHLYIHAISRNKNKEYSPFPTDHWQGGLKIIFVNPGVSQKCWWIKEKLFTKLKYLYRNIS